MATVDSRMAVITQNWVTVRDLMLCNTLYLSLNNKVNHAGIIFANSRFSAIPVVHRNGTYAGILKRELVTDKNVPGDSTIEPYIDSSVMPLQAFEPISMLKKLPVTSWTSIIPVVSESNRLLGMIPDPCFLKDVLGDIEKYLEIVGDMRTRDIGSCGIVVINLQGEIVFFNAQAEKILGVKGQEVYGIHINKVIPDSSLHKTLKNGSLQGKARLTSMINSICSARFPLLKDNDIIGAIGIFDDTFAEGSLNDRVKSLRSHNLEISSILESINDGIIVIDGNCNVIRTNATFELMTGVSANKVLGMHCSIFSGLLDCSPEPVVRDVLEKKKTIYVIQTIYDRDFLLIARPMFDGNCELVKVVIVMKDINYLNELIMNLEVARDITSRRRTEVFEEELQAAPSDMVVKSMVMRRVVSFAHKVAKVDSNILITGETGVGKEVVARSIHNYSYRLEGPFIKLNCGAIPEPLLESELFGYEPGAFTGAKKEGKCGLIELAEGGTLFLDEIGDLPASLQVKLLRVLQDREVMRVGGTTGKKVDFRLITATNKDLEQMIREKEFREDLYYRLNVVPIHVPPLRERKEDIIPLTIFFLNRFNKKYSLNKKISHEFFHSLIKYDWPGNIRELENTIERLVVTTDNDLIGVNEMISNPLLSFIDTQRDDDKTLKPLAEVLEETEKGIILKTLNHYKTTREMAEALGISQSAVVKKMKKYGIERQ